MRSDLKFDANINMMELNATAQSLAETLLQTLADVPQKDNTQGLKGP